MKGFIININEGQPSTKEGKKEKFDEEVKRDIVNASNMFKVVGQILLTMFKQEVVNVKNTSNLKKMETTEQYLVHREDSKFSNYRFSYKTRAEVLNINADWENGFFYIYKNDKRYSVAKEMYIEKIKMVDGAIQQLLKNKPKGENKTEIDDDFFNSMIPK